MARARVAVLINPEEGAAGHAYNNSSSSSSRWRAPPTSLDTNVLIVTSSLFAVLILALCMHFTIRWALTHFFHVTLPADSAPPLPPSPGLLKVHVDSLPTTLYTTDAELAVHVNASSASASASQCPICLADFADGDPIRVLPNCQHGFHVPCIDTWLALHTSCPLCRGNPINALPPEVVPSHVRLHILISALPATIS